MFLIGAIKAIVENIKRNVLVKNFFFRDCLVEGYCGVYKIKPVLFETCFDF